MCNYYYLFILLLLLFIYFIIVSSDSAAGGCVSGGLKLADKEALLAKLSVPVVTGEGAGLVPAAGGGGVGLVGELHSLVQLNQALSGIKMETANWEVVEKRE